MWALFLCTLYMIAKKTNIWIIFDSNRIQTPNKFLYFSSFLMQYSQQADLTDYSSLSVLTLSIWLQISFMIDDETIYIFIMSWCSIYKLLGWEISVYNQSYLCAQQVSV